MQKSEGVRGADRRLTAIAVLLAAVSAVRVEAYELPGVVSRGLGGAALPSVRRTWIEAPGVEPVAVMSISCAAPYGIPGLREYHLEAGRRVPCAWISISLRTLVNSFYRETSAGCTICPSIETWHVKPVFSYSFRSKRIAGEYGEGGGRLCASLSAGLPGGGVIEAGTVLQGEGPGGSREDKLLLGLCLAGIDFLADARRTDAEGVRGRIGTMLRLSESMTMSAGYDLSSSSVSTGIILSMSRISLAFSWEFHPVLGRTCSAGVQRVWSR